MKLAVCSDIHLEFGGIKLENTEGADVLVLSGDICVADDLRAPDPYSIMDSARTSRFHEFFTAASSNFKDVVYVMGNHEHYHGDFAKTSQTLKNHLKEFENVHFLDKECIELHGVMFYGGTLWTNFDIGYGVGDQSAMRHIRGVMNDYRNVKNSNVMTTFNSTVFKVDENGDIVYEKNENGFEVPVPIGMQKLQRVSTFSPNDSYEDHVAYMDGLQSALNAHPTKNFIVVGHHAPSKQSTHPMYAKETLINSAYSSNLVDFIVDNPRIKVWTHGHTHEPFDYMVQSTRIVCNPRGYDGYEQRAADFELKYIEV